MKTIKILTLDKRYFLYEDNHYWLSYDKELKIKYEYGINNYKLLNNKKLQYIFVYLRRRTTYENNY